MSTSVDKLIDGMSTPVLTKIVGMPDYDSVKVMNDELTGNAFSIQTNLGCGTVGYSRLTLTPAVFATISATAFIAPPNPGIQALIPANSTAIQITAINRAFDTAQSVYQAYVTVGNALKKQLLAAVEDIYICSLKQPYVAYGNVTVLQLLTHLYTTYARISPSDLAKNNLLMTRDYDANLPIEFLFKQIEDATAYADRGGAPYTPVQTVNSAYALVFKTGIFTDDCKEWQRLAAPDRTWIAFKAKFALAHLEWRESQTNTAGNTYGANNMEARADTANAINNMEAQVDTANAINALASATASDRDTMVSLSSSVATLTAQLATTQAQLAASQKALAKALASNTPGNYSGKPKSPYGPNRHYCWTCGFDCDHSSSDCPNKAANHIDHVNWRNTKGGSQANKK